MTEEVIPVLRVADAAAAVAWYRRLGFEREWEHRFAPNLPAFVSVARGSVRCSSASTRAAPADRRRLRRSVAWVALRDSGDDR